jgi:hypothetical protein
MANNICIDAVRKQLEKSDLKFSEKDVKAIHDELSKMRSKIFAKGESANGPEFMKKAMDMIQERRFQAAEARRAALINTIARNQNLAFAKDPAFAKSKYKAVLAALDGRNPGYAKNGKLSVDGSRAAMKDRLTNMLVTRLEQEGLLPMMEKGMMDKDIMVELFNVRDGKASGASGNPHAAKAAEIISGVNKEIVARLRSMGSSIREVVGYIARQSHDAEKIVAAGFEDWKAHILERLDIDKTFGNMSPAEIHERMGEVFNEIKSGSYGKDISAENTADQFLTVRGLSGDVGKRTARSRSLHFKDGNAFFEYNEKFGRGNLMEATFRAIDKQSRNYALMKQFGTNPEGGFHRWISDMSSEAKKTGDEVSIKDLESHKDRIAQHFDQAQGSIKCRDSRCRPRLDRRFAPSRVSQSSACLR